jgi:peptidyl-prolyl cis-trans isomerase D
MLDIMRRKKRLKAILWLVILSLALGMLLFFVPGTNIDGGSIDHTAATVDGHTIPMQDYLDRYRKTIDSYSNRGRNRIDPETLKALGISKRVLDGMVTTKVIEIAAERMGITVSPDEVRRAIETNPSLQDQGKFIGVDRYKVLLESNNITVEKFEEEVRYTEQLKKLTRIITDSLDVSDREMRDEFSRTNQQTQVDYVILKKEDFKKKLKPAESDLRAYFDAHKDAYKIKERRRAQYLLVPVSQILPGIKVTEQEVLDEWDQRPHEETVEAAHVLLKVDDPTKEAEVKKKAEEVLNRAKAGEDFAGLAKKYSEDTSNANQGGYLGPFQRGQMVKEFEDAAFSLKPGEISGLVRTKDYGYHIIKALRHEKPTLESNRGNITNSIQLRKAQAAAKLKAEEAAGLAIKQKDLVLAGKDLGIATEVKETDFFGKDDNPFAVGISQALRDQVFELKEINSIGKAVEHPLGYAVPKLLEVQLPKPGEFTASRGQVEKDYVESKSQELMQAEAQKLSEDAGKQGSLDKAAKAAGLSIKTSQQFKMDGTAAPEIGANAAFNSAAFELELGKVSKPIALTDSVAVLQVKFRSPFDESAYQKEKPGLRARMLQAKQEPYFQEYISKMADAMEQAGKIRINPKALEQSGKMY